MGSYTLQMLSVPQLKKKAKRMGGEIGGNQRGRSMFGEGERQASQGMGVRAQNVNKCHGALKKEKILFRGNEVRRVFRKKKEFGVRE